MRGVTEHNNITVLTLCFSDISYTSYIHNINQPFVCQNTTRILWKNPSKNGVLNMKMWFRRKTEEGKVDEFRYVFKCAH